MKYLYTKDIKAMKDVIRYFTFIFLLLLFSCDRDQVFEKEQYKNVFALISESDNVVRKFHNLGEESTGYND